jgi:hypothetical protein
MTAATASGVGFSGPRIFKALAPVNDAATTIVLNIVVMFDIFIVCLFSFWVLGGVQIGGARAEVINSFFLDFVFQYVNIEY